MTRREGRPDRFDALMRARETAAEALEAAERTAGVWALADKARDGPLIPYGVSNYDRPPLCSKEQLLENDLYWADQHDHARTKIREIYFSLPDMETRRRLIALHAELDEAIANHAKQRVSDAQSELQEMNRRAENPPWIAAGILGCVSVGIGSVFANLPGAIGGAILGYFWGKGMVSSARNDARAAAGIAESFLRDAEADYRDVAGDSWRPAYFSSNERRTGEPEVAFGALSAVERRLAMERK